MSKHYPSCNFILAKTFSPPHTQQLFRVTVTKLHLTHWSITVSIQYILWLESSGPLWQVKVRQAGERVRRRKEELQALHKNWP